MALLKWSIDRTYAILDSLAQANPILKPCTLPNFRRAWLGKNAR